MKLITMILAAAVALSLALSLAPSVAHALDGYQHRKGVFAGGGIGGGGGKTDADKADIRDGIGMVLQGRVGGGLNERLTMDLSYTWFTRDRTGHGLLAVGSNIFLTDELFLRLGVGLGRGIVTDSDGETLAEDFSMGLLAGGGIEFFLDANMAAGFTVQMQQHLVSSVRYTGVHGVAGITWY